MKTNTQGEEFEWVRKCLALKRHEQPPPGYFENFSHCVMARIHAEGDDAESHWVMAFWNRLLERPMLAGAIGAGIFGLVVFGLVYSPGEMPPGSVAPPELSVGWPASAPAASNPDTSPAASQPPGMLAAESSTNPIGMPQPLPSLFAPAHFKVEPASYTRGSN